MRRSASGAPIAAVEVGQPSYDPADLFKLYLYDDLNQVRSSRRLEWEICGNLELIWLLRGSSSATGPSQPPQENWAALKAANRGFVLLARKLDLFDGTLVAIDGAFFWRCQ